MLRVLFALVLFALSPVAAAQIVHECNGRTLEVLKGGSIVGQVTWDRRGNDFSVYGSCDSDCRAAAAACLGRDINRFSQLGHNSVSTPVGSVSRVGGKIFITIGVVVLAGIGIWFSFFAVDTVGSLVSRLRMFLENGDGLGKHGEKISDDDAAVVERERKTEEWLRGHEIYTGSRTADEFRMGFALLGSGDPSLVGRRNFDDIPPGVFLPDSDCDDDGDGFVRPDCENEQSAAEAAPAPAAAMWRVSDICDECGYATGNCICASRA